MKQFHTAVLERRKAFEGAFAVQPYETPWADEALFFLRIESRDQPRTAIRARVQVSVDGVRWIDEGTAFPVLEGDGDHFVRVRHFGGWLRLAGETEGGGAVLTVHLVLKG